MIPRYYNKVICSHDNPMISLNELVRELEKMQRSFPERESDEYDLGYDACWLDIMHKLIRCKKCKNK